MYTWGYIKECALAKLDLEEREANQQKLLNKFPYYANEVITQVCSSIKPKRTFVTFKVADKQNLWNTLKRKYGVYISEKMPIIQPDKLSEKESLFWKEYNGYVFINNEVIMPKDFISFGDDVCTRTWQDFMYNTIMSECHDNEFRYKGYNQIVFFEEGTYNISYNARWFTFATNLSDSTELDVPMDILECIPSYIAHQCYKIDDEYKSSVFRNEYEMMLARIDNTDFKANKMFVIGGDW